MDTVDPYLTRELSLSDANDRLRRAGIGGRVIEARICAGGVTNFNHELRLADGGRLLLRTYGGQGASADESRRTELAVDPLLSALGVKAPHVVAAPDDADFVLFEWLDGMRLRDACPVEPDRRRLERAWFETGQALRATHDVPTETLAGFVRAGGTRNTTVAWVSLHRRLIEEAAAALVVKSLISAHDAGRITTVATQTATFIGSWRPSLLHGDSHAANVLVRNEDAGWVLSGWIDWERSCVADAESDLATFDLFTRAQVGETAKAFWDGYGRAPDLSRFRFYQLQMALFLASLDHAQRLPPGREARRLVTTSLGTLLEGLEN
jgi:aminoglycoside phosphotransferase (APT) family kinase protein